MKTVFVSKRYLGILIICSVFFITIGVSAWYDIFSFAELKALDEIYMPLRRPQISGKILLVKIDRKSEDSEAFGDQEWEYWNHEDWLPPLASALNTHELVGGENNSIGILISLNGNFAHNSFAIFV